MDSNTTSPGFKRQSIMGYPIASLRQSSRFAWSKDQNDIVHDFINHNGITKQDLKDPDLSGLYSSLGFDCYHGVVNDESTQVINIVKPKLIGKLRRTLDKMLEDDKYSKSLASLKLKPTRSRKKVPSPSSPSPSDKIKWESNTPRHNLRTQSRPNAATRTQVPPPVSYATGMDNPYATNDKRNEAQIRESIQKIQMEVGDDNLDSIDDSDTSAFSVIEEVSGSAMEPLRLHQQRAGPSAYLPSVTTTAAPHYASSTPPPAHTSRTTKPQTPLANSPITPRRTPNTYDVEQQRHNTLPDPRGTAFQPDLRAPLAERPQRVSYAYPVGYGQPSNSPTTAPAASTQPPPRASINAPSNSRGERARQSGVAGPSATPEVPLQRSLVSSSAEPPQRPAKIPQQSTPQASTGYYHQPEYAYASSGMFPKTPEPSDISDQHSAQPGDGASTPRPRNGLDIGRHNDLDLHVRNSAILLTRITKRQDKIEELLEQLRVEMARQRADQQRLCREQNSVTEL